MPKREIHLTAPFPWSVPIKGKRKREIIDKRKKIKKILRFSFIDKIDKKIIIKKESEP